MIKRMLRIPLGLALGALLLPFFLLCAMVGAMLWAVDELFGPKAPAEPSQAEELPPAEERPHIPAPAVDALVEARRIEQALREEFLRERYKARRTLTPWAKASRREAAEFRQSQREARRG